METNGTSQHESLGTLLRRVRLERSLEIADIAEETKITPDTIRAMEADDFDALPALAFARGFYSLYAGMLGLDPEEIIRRFQAEYKGRSAEDVPGGVAAPSWQGEKIGTIAGRPSNLLGTVIGIGILLVILLGAGLSWYAGYNPAKQISHWLRGFQQTEVQQADPLESTGVETGLQPAVPQVVPQETPPPPPRPSIDSQAGEPAQYQLVAEFQDAADITVSIDGGQPEHFSLASGTIRTWQADESIVLEIPQGTPVRLYLNGILVPLPAPENGTMTIAIPEYLLD